MAEWSLLRGLSRSRERSLRQDKGQVPVSFRLALDEWADEASEEGA